MNELGSLTQPLTRVRRRLRWQRALEALAWTGVAVLGWTAVALLAERLGHAGWLQGALWLGAGSLALATLGGALWPVPARLAAQRIDWSHALYDRVQSALEFTRSEAPTPFMRAAVQDALERSGSISPRRAVPLHAPRAVRYSVPAALVLALARLAPLPRPEAEQPESAPGGGSVVASLDPETTRAFAAEARALVTPSSAETRALVERYDTLLTRLGRGEMTREQALEELAALQRRIEATREGSSALTEGLRRLARALGAEKITSQLARALEQGDLEAAATALEELSTRMARQAMPRAQREALQRALKRAAEQLERETSRQAREPELLKKDRKQAADSRPEPQLLKKKERELEQLQRETSREKRDASRRKLEQLRRELAEAAARDGAQAAEALNEAAKQTRGLAGDQQDLEQQRRLSEQLDQLRQELQRQQRMRGPQQGGGESQAGPQDPQGQAERMQRFRLRAQGEEDPPPKGDGGSMPLVMRRPDEQRGDGGPGDAGKSPGSGSDAQAGDAGSQGTPQQVLELGGDGPATASLEMPGMGGERTASSASDESDFSEQSNDPRLRGKTRDSQLQGLAGRGPSRSQVIVDAADRGFATTPYRDVYTDYREHAEDVLERDEIPPGYRFYVRRYFQLIRPRQEGNAP